MELAARGGGRRRYLIIEGDICLIWSPEVNINVGRQMWFIIGIDNQRQFSLELSLEVVARVRRWSCEDGHWSWSPECGNNDSGRQVESLKTLEGGRVCLS